jgi:hypothetical protein
VQNSRHLQGFGVAATGSSRCVCAHVCAHACTPRQSRVGDGGCSRGFRGQVCTRCWCGCSVCVCVRVWLGRDGHNAFRRNLEAAMHQCTHEAPPGKDLFWRSGGAIVPRTYVLGRPLFVSACRGVCVYEVWWISAWCESNLRRRVGVRGSSGMGVGGQASIRTLFVGSVGR